MYVNEVHYQRENYTEGTLDRHMTSINYPIRSTENSITNYYIRQASLESEERYTGDGFFPREE